MLFLPFLSQTLTYVPDTLVWYAVNVYITLFPNLDSTKYEAAWQQESFQYKLSPKMAI